MIIAEESSSHSRHVRDFSQESVYSDSAEPHATVNMGI